jgi:hypothetical protein
MTTNSDVPKPSSPSTLPSQPDVKAEPPQTVQEFSEVCVRYVQRAFEIELDYEPDTLSILDHYVLQARADMKERPEALDLLAAAVGAYLGEVLRRQYDCWWAFPREEPSGWELRFSNVYLSIRPMMLAYASLAPNDDDWFSQAMVLEDDARQTIHERLAQLPPVSEEDFLRPTTQMEVIDIIIDHLKIVGKEEGLGDVRFADEDYQDPIH